jgi:hypothetical protein
MAKTNQESDPHGTELTWLPGSGSGSALRENAGSINLLKTNDTLLFTVIYLSL